MQEFIFLFRGGKTTDASEERLEKHEQDWETWMDQLDENGVLIDGLPMKDHAVIIDQHGKTARDLSADDSVTGYLILEAEDMDAAVEMADGCPIFDFGGSVEVRGLDAHRGDED